jgi:hypothetical protein
MNFKKDDHVAWSTTLAPQHGEGSVLQRTSVASQDPGARLGTVTGVANDEGTYYTVDFGKGEKRVLTADELVRVTAD